MSKSRDYTRFSESGEELPPIERSKSPPPKKKKKSETTKIKIRENNTSSSTQALLEAIRDLKAVIKANNDHLEVLSLAQGRVPISPRSAVYRDTKALVEINLSFLHVIDIHTKYGYFHAEIYLRAKWREPLNARNQSDLDQIDFSDGSIWKPDLVLVNAMGQPDDAKRWYNAVADEDNNAANMYMHIRYRGQFKEALELKDFPVDKQDLTVTITCERPFFETELLASKEQLSTVTQETFNDAKEFQLWDYVGISTIVADEASDSDKYAMSSKVSFTCAVSRKPTYFLVNGLLLQFLIVTLTFLVYVHDANEFSTRSGLSATLLLTSVAFQFTVMNELPNVPYITVMGWYHLICRIYQVVIILQSGIAYYLSTTNTITARLFDQVAFGIILSTFILFNLIYIIVLGVKYRKMYTDLVQKEQMHKEKKTIRSRPSNVWVVTHRGFRP